MANPTDNTSTPTGNAPLSNVGGSSQQFVVWSKPWLARPSVAPWNTYLAAISAAGQNIK